MRWLLKRKENNHGYMVENVGVGCELRWAMECRPKLKNATAKERLQRPRNHRVRHFSRGSSGNRHYCHCGISSEARRALGCHCHQHGHALEVLKPQGVLGAGGNHSGQSTVEFAVITGALVAILAGLGALWHGLEGGLLVSHALASASHHLSQVPLPFVADIFRY